MESVFKYDESKEVKNIILFYKNLYELFFKFGVYFLLFIIALVFIFFHGFKSVFFNVDYHSGVNNLIENNDYIYGNKVSFYNKKINNFDVNIVGGYVFSSGSIFYSQDNLAFISGFVIPIGFATTNNLDISHINSFTGDYSFSNFENVFKTLVFNYNVDFLANLNPQFPNINLKKLPDSESIKDLFYLRCLDSFKVFNDFCIKNINNFFTGIYGYEIGTNQTILLQLYDSFKNNGKEKNYCDSLMQYFHYTYDISNVFGNVFNYCGKDYYDKYEYLKRFKLITIELNERTSISNNTYENELNEYKLVSLQRLIYVDNLNSGKINLNLIISYLNYVDKLLETGGVSKIYFDFIYYYNNSFLINLVKDNINDAIREDVQEIIKRIEIINLGNNFGSKSIINLLVNDNLIKYLQKDTLDINIGRKITGKEMFEGYLNNIKQRFDLKNYTFNDGINEYYAIGSLKISDSKNIIEVPVKIRFDNTGNSFFVKAIEVNSNEKMTNYFSGLLKNNTLTFSSLLEHVEAYIKSGDSNPNFNLCDSINDSLSKVQSNLYKIVVKNCTNSRVLIEKEYTESNKIIRYMFNFGNLRLTDYKIYDQELSDYILSLGQKTNISIYNAPSFIFELLLIEIPVSTNVDISTIRKIQDTFIEYLGAKIESIESKGDKGYVVEFKLSNFNLLGMFSPNNNNRLSPLYLQKPVGNGKFEHKEIEGFKMYLITKYKLDFKQFAQETEKFLREIDNSSVNFYLNLSQDE